MKQRRLWLAVVVVTALALVGCGSSSGSSKGGSTGSATGPITVWVDAARLPVAQAYQGPSEPEGQHRHVRR